METGQPVARHRRDCDWHRGQWPGPTNGPGVLRLHRRGNTAVATPRRATRFCRVVAADHNLNTELTMTHPISPVPDAPAPVLHASGQSISGSASGSSPLPVPHPRVCGQWPTPEAFPFARQAQRWALRLLMASWVVGGIGMFISCDQEATATALDTARALAPTVAVFGALGLAACAAVLWGICQDARQEGVEDNE